MRHVITADREQTHLLPMCIEDWIGPGHPARYIAMFVEQMDLRAAGLDTLNRHEGGRAFEPSVLLGVWLYGYYTKRRSCRQLEEACRDDMGFIWLSGNNRPDHNSLWRYWNTHRKQLGEVFKRTLKVALEMRLVDMVEQAVDGTKIAAACGKGNYEAKRLEKLMEAADERIAALEKQIEQAGQERAVELPVELRGKQELKKRLESALGRVKKGETKSANPGEVEATLMSKGPAYNAQAVSEQKAQIVVAAEVSDQVSDQRQLVAMIEKAKANLAEARGEGGGPDPEKVRTLADGGYASAQNFHDAVRAGHEVLTPPPVSWRDISGAYHSAHFKYEKERDVVICPAGRELTHSRTRMREGKQLEVYGKRGECEGCAVRKQCTRSKHNRTVELPAKGYEELVRRRREWEEPGVKKEYGKRAGMIEPVFAQIKNVMGFRRWTHRGLEKVGEQWRMLCAIWNLKVIVRHWRAAKLA